MKVWEVKGTYNLDGITESETWLYYDRSMALSFFQSKAEEDYAEIKGRCDESEIHVNSENSDEINDGDYVIEYGQYDYCSYEQGYGMSTMVEYSLREKEIK